MLENTVSGVSYSSREPYSTCHENTEDKDQQPQLKQLNATYDNLRIHFHDFEDPLVKQGLEQVLEEMKKAHNNPKDMQMQIENIMKVVEGKESICGKENEIKKELRQLAFKKKLNAAQDEQDFVDLVDQMGEWARQHLGENEEIVINEFTGRKLRNADGHLQLISSSDDRERDYEPSYLDDFEQRRDELIEMFQNLKEMLEEAELHREQAEEQLKQLNELDGGELEEMMQQYHQFS